MLELTLLYFRRQDIMMPNLDGKFLLHEAMRLVISMCAELQADVMEVETCRRLGDVVDPPIRPDDTHHLDDEQLGSERHHDLLLARSVSVPGPLEMPWTSNCRVRSEGRTPCQSRSESG